MSGIKARQRPSRSNPGQVHFYCGGEGCSRSYRLATWRRAGPGGPPRGIEGWLNAHIDFKKQGDEWVYRHNSTKPRGRTVAYDWKGLAGSSPDSYSKLREKRDSFPLPMTGSEPHLMRCPECDALNIVRSPETLTTKSTVLH